MNRQTGNYIEKSHFLRKSHSNSLIFLQFSMDTIDQMAFLAKGMAGKRLKYKKLTKELPPERQFVV